MLYLKKITKIVLDLLLFFWCIYYLYTFFEDLTFLLLVPIFWILVIRYWEEEKIKLLKKIPIYSFWYVLFAFLANLLTGNIFEFPGEYIRYYYFSGAGMGYMFLLPIIYSEIKELKKIKDKKGTK